MTTRTVPIHAIAMTDRYRREMGDVGLLAESINRVGLLHPVVVTPGGRLVAGARRLMAMELLGWHQVPVTIADSLDDAHELLMAERDENTCRKDMTASEKVGLGRALEELERPKAAERKAATQAQPGHRVGEGKFPSPSRGERTGKVYDLVGEAVGMSGPIYKRAKAVVKAAEAGNPTAREALAEMDTTGKVTPAYDKMRDNGTPSTNAKRVELQGRDLMIANAAHRRVAGGLCTIDGVCLGLKEIPPEKFLAVSSPDELRDMVAIAERAIATLRQFHRALRKEL